MRVEQLQSLRCGQEIACLAADNDSRLRCAPKAHERQDRVKRLAPDCGRRASIEPNTVGLSLRFGSRRPRVRISPARPSRFEALKTADFGMLQRYVRLATERDLGPRAAWLELIANNPATEWS